MLKLGHGYPVPMHDLKASDRYGKRRKHVQFLVEQFWKRWVTEYRPTLQRRRRWIQGQPNFKIGDLVLVKDDNITRCQWPLSRILKTFPGSDGLVWSVEVRSASGSHVRPITKLCLLEDAV